MHSVYVAKRSNIRVNELIHYNNIYTYSVRHEIQSPTKDNILSGLPTCICTGTLRKETFPNIDTTRIYAAWTVRRRPFQRLTYRCVGMNVGSR